MTDALYPEDTLVVVNTSELTVDAFGRLVKTRLVGRLDGIVYYSYSEDFNATPIHASLSLSLVESGTSGTYTALFQGDVLELRLGNVSTGTPIYRHTYFGTDAHKVDRLFWRSVRT